MNPSVSVNKAKKGQSVLDQQMLDTLPPSLKAILPKMADAGFRDIEDQLRLLSQGAYPADKPMLIRCAHSIKACAAQLGGLELAEFSKQKEQQYSAGSVDELAEDTTEFLRLFERFKNAVQEYLQQRTLT